MPGFNQFTPASILVSARNSRRRLQNTEVIGQSPPTQSNKASKQIKKVTFLETSGEVNDEQDVHDGYDVDDAYDVDDEYDVDDRCDVARITANNDCSQLWRPRPHLNGTNGVLEITEFQQDWTLKKTKLTYREATVKLIHMVGDVILYVTAESPNIVKSWNRKTHKLRQFISDTQNVKGIKASGNYVTFILYTKILIFKVEANGEIGPLYMEVYHDRVIRSSAVAMASDAPVIALPVLGLNTVRVISLKSKKEISEFTAHICTIVCVALNSSATKLASTSVFGTVVKVFTNLGLLLHKFRRAMVRFADMEAIHFSHDSNWIACSNKNKTIHVFKLEEARKAAVEPSTWASYFTSLPKAVLRTGATCVPSMDYAFATLHIDFPGQEFLGFMPPHGDTAGFVVADQASLMLHTYKFDVHQGGECELHHSFAVDGFRSLDAPVIVSNQPAVIEDHNFPLVWIENHFD